MTDTNAPTSPAPVDATTEPPTLADQLAAGTPPGRPVPDVVLSYGLGVDSTAILLRWLDDPASRDFPLDRLVVVTAMTGDEWDHTRRDVETHVLPRLAEHRIRYVQVARNRRHTTTTGAGITVLSDTTTPTRLHLHGAYKLSDELREAGTIPQTGGMRACSVHAKGDALDPTIGHLTAGRPYRHVIGFEANEERRATKDTGYNTSVRTGEYPLIEWGWDRDDCLEYLHQITGITWAKSACVYCPFSMTSKAGLARTLDTYRTHPAAGASTLLLEHTALALNPTQGLIAGNRAIDAVTAAGLTDVLARYTDRLHTSEHTVYEVRRLRRPRRDDPTKVANAARSLRTLHTGTRDHTPRVLADLAAAHHTSVTVGDDHIARVWIRRRGTTLPSAEHYYVAAPTGALPKADKNFDSWWDDVTAQLDTTTGDRVA